MPENITVAEASQLCAAKRTDCVLVVDDEEGLSGIFTAKDLAYRVGIFLYFRTRMLTRVLDRLQQMDLTRTQPRSDKL